MTERYVVKQGDFVAKIARKFGFSSSLPIWDDAQNAELKKQRKNPNILFPGDELVVRAKQPKEESGSTEKRVKFKLQGEKLMLRLVLEDTFNAPIANAECTLTLDGQALKLVSDGKGKIETEVPATIERITLAIVDKSNPVNDRIIALHVGDLDPLDKVSGQKGRLANLGYFVGPLDQDATDAFHSAVEEFQCEHMGKSAVDGVCGPKTQAKLKEVYGC